MKFQKIIFIYKLYMMIYLLAAFNGFLNGGILIKAGSVIGAIFGAALLVFMLFRWKRYWKMPNFILCILFLVSYMLSSLMNIKYGITENIQELMWMACQIGVLYIAGREYTSQMMKAELKILGSVYVVWCTAANIVSLTMISWGYEYGFTDAQNYTHWLGYLRGRLWGVYDDPNHGATITVIAIFMMLYLWGIFQKRWQRVCIAASMVINLLYIGFSNSRTAVVCIGCGLLCWCFLHTYNQKKSAVKAVVFSLAVTALAVGGLSAFEPINVQLFKSVQDQMVKKIEKSNNTETVKSPIKKTNARRNELKKDVSSGREDIWKSGIEIMGTSPVFGISFRNIVAYAEENLPKTYILNNEVVKYDSLHNMFVDVVVSQGIIGILIVFMMIGNTIRVMWKSLSRLWGKDYSIIIFSFIIVVTMTVASQFYTYLFYLHAPQTFFFWLCMGYLMTLARDWD